MTPTLDQNDAGIIELQFRTVQAKLKAQFDKVPDMDAVLFLIGIQEVGRLPRKKYTKEEKQDLIHVAMCRLFKDDGYFTFSGLDADGWPHYDLVKEMPKLPLHEQELLIKTRVIGYFETLGFI